MKKFYKFLKRFLFISIWLILSSFVIQYWGKFHYEYIEYNLQIIFYKEYWFDLEKLLFGSNFISIKCIQKDIKILRK